MSSAGLYCCRIESLKELGCITQAEIGAAPNRLPIDRL